MASKKKIFRIGNNLDPFCQVKLKDLPREVAIKNMSFDEWGNLIKRAGYAKWNTTSISATKKITGLHRFYKQTETSKYCLVVCDTGIYVLAEAAGHAAGSSLATVTTDSDAYFIDFVDRCLIANGKENLMKFNGTVIYIAGTTPVPTAPSGVAGSSGSLSLGNYYFKTTYIDADGNESNASVASAVVAVTAGQKVTVTPVIYSGSNYDIDYINIYRTLAGGASYYYDGQVANTAAITFSSTQSDAALVQANSLENYHEENHNAPPSAPSLIAKRGGRIYLAVGNKLYYSKRYYEYFPANFWIPPGNMRNITGIINQCHTLQVATKNSVERLLGTSTQIESADYFQFKDSYSSKGVYASRSLVDCDNYIVFLHKDGLYIVNIDQVKELNVVLNKYLKANINQAHIDKSCACFYDGKYMLSYPKGDSTVPSETVYYDFKDGTYGIFDFAFNVYSVWGQAGEDSLKAGSTTVGRVYDVFGTALDDDGSAIEAYDTLPYLYFGNPDTYKQVYNFYIKIKSTTITNTTVDADSAAAQKVLNVAATTNFAVGELVVINEGGAREETRTIDTIQDNVSLTMTEILTYAHTAVQADTVKTFLRFYYQLDDEDETYKDVMLTADKTRWYKVDLSGGGQRCRGIKLRPRMNDKFYWEEQGINIVYRDEAKEWGEE